LAAANRDTRTRYVLDRARPDESRRRWKLVHGGTVQVRDGNPFYKVVIRDTGRPGWVFRFRDADAWAHDTLHALNQSAV
jgi:hypothetical protein